MLLARCAASSYYKPFTQLVLEVSNSFSKVASRPGSPPREKNEAGGEPGRFDHVLDAMSN